MSKRKKPARKGWTVDARGRWRDERGRFAPRKALLANVGGVPENAGRALTLASKRAKRARGDYIVLARFADVGWRSLSFAQGLSAALAQAGDWLEHQIGLELGFYGRQPYIHDIEVRRWTPPERKKKKPTRSRRAKKTSRSKR
jgi:hypothetical protein